MMNTTDIHDPTFFDKFFVSIGVFVTASFLSFSLVALAMRPVHPYSEDLEEDNDGDDEEPFKKRFYDEFNDMERVELTDEEKSALAEKHLRIETDDGEVVIRYNSERDSFDYWCDNSNIGYLELDAVAQAYAIENNCASVVVNYKKEYDTALEEWKKKNETDYEGAEADSDDENKKKISPEEDVFASFKNYKTDPINKKGDHDKPTIDVKNANKFRRAGSIKDYDDKENESSEEEKPNVSLTFAEWKAQENQSQESDETKKDK